MPRAEPWASEAYESSRSFPVGPSRPSVAPRATLDRRRRLVQREGGRTSDGSASGGKVAREQRVRPGRSPQEFQSATVRSGSGRDSRSRLAALPRRCELEVSVRPGAAGHQALRIAATPAGGYAIRLCPESIRPHTMPAAALPALLSYISRYFVF